MFFVALAADYDGTLAEHGQVDEQTRQALRDLRGTGRKLLMVTGRELAQLQSVFDALDLFDMVVAENGALLYDPATKEEIPLTEPPPEALIARLREAGVEPLSVGRGIIATWEPHEKLVLDAIRDLELEQQIVFNKGAVMVLPSGVNKASGLQEALRRLKLSALNVVGIGDAENDQAFLAICGCAVAVENALDTVKAKADFVVADHGAGVIEVAKSMAEDDLAGYHSLVPHHRPALGENAEGECIEITPFETVLVAGSSGAGKTTVVVALLEQLRKLQYQFCVIDPEGDYAGVRDTVVIGDERHAPRIEAAIDLLAKPETNVVINVLAIELKDRPRFIANLLPELAKLRTDSGRPHWIIIDEVHHCLPAQWDPSPVTLPQRLPGVIAVTVDPGEVAPDFLAMVTTMIGVGEGGPAAIEKLCSVVGAPAFTPGPAPGTGEVLVYRIGDNRTSVVRARRPAEKQQRHIRKYADGDVGDDLSFYFRGPKDALKLRARNLMTFVELAAGVDEATWLHHLHERAYSMWFRDVIKDPGLATDAAAVEKDTLLTADESRARIKEIVERRYTAPARAERQ